MERDEGNGGDSGESFASKMKKEGTAFGTSIWEGWQQTKATIIAQVILFFYLCMNPLNYLSNKFHY